MATSADIAKAREYISEPDDTNGWTDARIGEYVDSAPDLFGAAAEVWSVKAASYAALVDVSESGSSRRMGSLHRQALDMHKHYAEKSAGLTASTAGAPFTVPIVRKR